MMWQHGEEEEDDDDGNDDPEQCGVILFCKLQQARDLYQNKKKEKKGNECHQSLSEEKEDFNPVWISQNLNWFQFCEIKRRWRR
jgi:hypothetical protein